MQSLLKTVYGDRFTLFTAYSASLNKPELDDPYTSVRATVWRPILTIKQLTDELYFHKLALYIKYVGWSAMFVNRKVKMKGCRLQITRLELFD